MEDRKKGKKMGWFRSNIKEFIKDKVQNLECTPCSYSVDTGQPLLLASRIMEAPLSRTVLPLCVRMILLGHEPEVLFSFPPM